MRQASLMWGGALDLGILTVIKDMGLKEPYSGQCELKTGEIAEDLTYYFATSEQIPSAVGLGVLVDKDQSVKQLADLSSSLCRLHRRMLWTGLKRKSQRLIR